MFVRFVHLEVKPDRWDEARYISFTVQRIERGRYASRRRHLWDRQTGRYRAEGMMFHMPGEWELRLQLVGKDGAGAKGLTHDIAVE